MASKLRQGAVVDGYRLEALLGEGGYGTVWKATQLNVDRTVAIKFLKVVVGDLSAEKRFEREAKALARLQHPNCVTLLNFGRGSAGAFLVTEFVDGERLDHWAEDEHDLETIFGVAFQMLSALNHAHQERIIHRDLKPANVVISTNVAGEVVVKVLDFGIASVVGAKRGDITKTGEVFGTPGYMAPEQLLGDNNVGPAADLYAFGVVLFQMIERRKLFTAKSGIEVALKHLSNSPPSITRPIPHGLQEIVDRLLAKQAEDRYQSAEEVARALQRVGTRLDQPRPPAQPPAGAPPQPELPTPPTRPTGQQGSEGTPMGYSPTGYSGAYGSSSSDSRVRPVLEPPTPRHEDLWQLLVGLIVGIGALAFTAYQLMGSDSPPDPGTVKPAAGAVALLRSEHKLQVQPLPSETEMSPDASVVETTAPDMPETSAGCGGVAFKGGFQTISVMVDALSERSVRVYVPQGYDPSVPHQTLVAFHDTSQLAHGMFTELDLGPPADRDRVVIVFPEVPHPINPWKEPHEVAGAVKDLTAAREALCLKNRNVLLFGFGSGGHAAQKLACLVPGVAAIVQSTYRMLKFDEVCRHPDIPYLFMAPMKDGRDPVEGGTGCLHGSDVVSVDEHERFYREMYGCEGPSRVEAKHHTSICHTWSCDSTFVACRIDGGRPLPGQRDAHRLHDCEGPRANFPYRDKAWSFLIDAVKK